VRRRRPAVKAALVAAAILVSAAGVGAGGERNDASLVGSVAVPKLVIPKPRPPRSYPLPRPAVQVSTSAQLTAALRRPSPTNIVLAPGTYDAAGPFSNRSGHRLFARRVARTVLTAGLSIGSNAGPPGGLVRGVTFDVRDPDKTFNGAVIAVWGEAANAGVFDVTLRGNETVRSGVVVRQPDGFRGMRIQARGFTDYGVLVDANEPARQTLRRPFVLSDVDVAGVARAMPRSSNGTAEACVWLGNPGIVRSVRVRRCAWMGIWTGTAATGLRLDRVDVDSTPTGVYVEHFTRRSTFQRLRIGPAVRVGLVTEWASPAAGGLPASVDNVIQDSRFESWLAGVYLDAGTTRTIVRRSSFARQRWAAVGDHHGVGNQVYENDYRGIASSAVPLTHDHIQTAGG
jgi:hypothetical protein